ncbi:A24 family peptidase [Caulobacter sp. KR2-114]|uniref:A24 family peptidase n=1 Tax=Caulobacter sp. KR2-114 TaxID=3400912 RepID=UPI003BFBFDD6
MSADVLRSLMLVVFAGLVVIAAIRDLTTYTIPNWISLALAAAFAPAALAAGETWPAIGLSLLVGVGMLAVGIVMFALRWIGGGDAKLMAAASMWLGVQGLIPFVLYTGLAGGALALMLLAVRSAWLRPFAAVGPGWVDRLATPGGATPYGVAIAVGALGAFPLGALMSGAHAGF